jgi:hypothetical protein
MWRFGLIATPWTILSLLFNSKWLPSLPKKSADDSEQIKGPVAC